MISEGMISQPPWKLILGATVLLAVLVIFPLASVYPNFVGDDWAIREFQSARTGWLDQIFRALSTFGLVYVFIPVAAVISVALLASGRRADAFFTVFCLIPIAAGTGLKAVVDRARPDYAIMGADPSGLSFPSGHAVVAMVMGGLFIMLVGEFVRPPLLRRGLQGAIALLVLAVGASRVYLGVHWPSDVIGGFLYGALSLMALFAVRNVMARDGTPDGKGRVNP